MSHWFGKRSRMAGGTRETASDDKPGAPGVVSSARDAALPEAGEAPVVLRGRAGGRLWMLILPLLLLGGWWLNSCGMLLPRGQGPADTAAVPVPAKVAVESAPAAAPAAIAVEAARPIPGLTTTFGKTAATVEAAAIPNPDYTPAAAVAGVVEAVKLAGPVPGVTSYYAAGEAFGERPAVANPDYQAAVVVAAVEPPALVVPGVTSYFEKGEEFGERPAVANPDYQAAVVAAPVVPGLTSYYGTAAAAFDTSARANPEYRVAVAKPAANTVCQDKVNAAVKSGEVRFETGSSDLTDDSLVTLQSVAKAFKACPGARMRIEGHTDDVGAADMNMQLSQARAQSVADYLASQGVPESRVSPEGFGMTRPLVPNTNAGNRAQNRRIEFAVAPL